MAMFIRSLLLLSGLATKLSRVESLSTSPTYETIQKATFLNSENGSSISSPILNSDTERKKLVVILPQLGDFDTAELIEHLVPILPKLNDEKIDLKVIGIGDLSAAQKFIGFTGLPSEYLFLDPKGQIHRDLKLKRGPNWDVPDFVSDDVLSFMLNQLPGGKLITKDVEPSENPLLKPVARAWLNYLLMCAGIGAPGTLQEILRGYFGDFDAPERFAKDDVVEAGGSFLKIGPGVGPVKLGPFSYTQWFADERGYQRPVELATVRLKNMVEVLTNWDTYVSDPANIDLRGGTFLFSEDGEMLYEYQHRGVLTYSETMPRPLTFLGPYIGEELARNPIGLLDLEDTKTKNPFGRGILKPAGKLMTFLKPLFEIENKAQARLQGATDEGFVQAEKSINEKIKSNKVVIYTYGLSPFSSQAVSLLKDAGCEDYCQVELGQEWFLLDKEASTVRAKLLDMTGQSSLPHIFINGEHIGGIFSGPDEKPGLAALQESGELQSLISEPATVEV